MASMERGIADAIKTSLSAYGYISSNSIPVRHWDDNQTARAMPCVLVRVSPREVLTPGYPFCKMVGTVTVCHDRDDDPNAAVADLIYDAVASWQSGDHPYYSLYSGTYFAATPDTDDPFYRATNGDGGAWTFSALFTPSEETTSARTILAFGDFTGANGAVLLQYHGGVSSRKLTLTYGSVTANLSLSTPVNSMTPGKSHHIAVTFDGGTTGDTPASVATYLGRFKIWINGTSQTITGSATADGFTGAIPAGTYRIGKSGYGVSDSMDGDGIGEVAVWASDRTATMATIYNGGAPHDLTILSPQPFSYWPMGGEAQPPDTIDDEMGNADLSVTGAPVIVRGLNAALLSVDGIVNMEGSEEVEGAVHFRGISFEIYESIS